MYTQGVGFLGTRDCYKYKVDKLKRHHASRKPVGGESIPALGFYGSATLGWDPASFRFQYCVHCLVSWVYEFSFMSYSTQQRIFSVILSWKNLCGESVAESFVVNFPILLVPDKTTIYRLVKIINETGSVQNEKSQVNKGALTDDKLDEIGFQLAQIPQ